MLTDDVNAGGATSHEFMLGGVGIFDQQIEASALTRNEAGRNPPARTFLQCNTKNWHGTCTSGSFAYPPMFVLVARSNA